MLSDKFLHQELFGSEILKIAIMESRILANKPTVVILLFLVLAMVVIFKGRYISKVALLIRPTPQS